MSDHLGQDRLCGLVSGCVCLLNGLLRRVQGTDLGLEPLACFGDAPLLVPRRIQLPPHFLDLRRCPAQGRASFLLKLAEPQFKLLA